jgi:hypothetical protein
LALTLGYVSVMTYEAIEEPSTTVSGIEQITNFEPFAKNPGAAMEPSGRTFVPTKASPLLTDAETNPEPSNLSRASA